MNILHWKPLSFTYKPKIVQLIQTCSACPSQWEGKTADGQQVYIRYRWGHLSIGVDPEDAVLNPNWSHRVAYGDALDGYMSDRELVVTLGNTVKWDSKLKDRMLIDVNND
jgi:hypothetical protein